MDELPSGLDEYLPVEHTQCEFGVWLSDEGREVWITLKKVV